jgi:predicted  nucleic acid-binding Zn-ribbon protein
MADDAFMKAVTDTRIRELAEENARITQELADANHYIAGAKDQIERINATLKRERVEHGREVQSLTQERDEARAEAVRWAEVAEMRKKSRDELYAVIAAAAAAIDVDLDTYESLPDEVRRYVAEARREIERIEADRLALRKLLRDASRALLVGPNKRREIALRISDYLNRN